MACFALLPTLEVIRIAIKAIFKNRPGSWIVLIGLSVALLFEALNVYFVVLKKFVEAGFSVAVVFATVPLYLSFFMAGEFARSGLALQKRAVEIKLLSDKTIAQEQEKQQILSSQKETLENQVTERTTELKQSLHELKSTQALLIQSEKMASLGELTAGIAHEIQNPLNFVNNFSEVNTELIDEMKVELAAGNIKSGMDIANSIRENEEKISVHGKRADSIVKGMLQHSRDTASQKEPTDINALADEYLRLSYQGFRAKDKSFITALQSSFDPNLTRIDIIPQEIGRVLLNLYNNAFYAVSERNKQQPEGYEPIVSVSTQKIDGKVEIRVKDNGNGIPEKVS